MYRESDMSEVLTLFDKYKQLPSTGTDTAAGTSTSTSKKRQHNQATVIGTRLSLKTLTQLIHTALR